MNMCPQLFSYLGVLSWHVIGWRLQLVYYCLYDHHLRVAELICSWSYYRVCATRSYELHKESSYHELRGEMSAAGFCCP